MAAIREIPAAEGTRLVSSMSFKTTIIVAVAVLVVVSGVATIKLWTELGDVETGGWTAIVFGLVLAMAVGIGLMALMFISSRRGFDEPN